MLLLEERRPFYLESQLQKDRFLQDKRFLEMISYVLNYVDENLYLITAFMLKPTSYHRKKCPVTDCYSSSIFLTAWVVHRGHSWEPFSRSGHWDESPLSLWPGIHSAVWGHWVPPEAQMARLSRWQKTRWAKKISCYRRWRPVSYTHLTLPTKRIV